MLQTLGFNMLPTMKRKMTMAIANPIPAPQPFDSCCCVLVGALGPWGLGMGVVEVASLCVAGASFTGSALIETGNTFGGGSF